MAEILVLFDGNALLHRAFHALPPLTTSKGELVNATYGFALMLFKVLNELKPKYVAVAFDKAAPTFRHKEFEAYKAQRPKAPEGLFEQLERVKQLVRILNVPIFEIEGYEADDVLGTLSRQASERGLDTVIVSGDTDILQLVGPRVKALTPGRVFSETTAYDESAVREKYGLEPRQLIDFKGLKGDPSDNIPGVPGIGEKTAKKLLAQFGSIEEMYARLDQVEEKTRRVLAAHRDEATQSKHLATIVTDVPIELDLESCHAGAYERTKVLELLRELEFRSLLGRLPDQAQSRLGASALGQRVAPATQAEPTRQMRMFGVADGLDGHSPPAKSLASAPASIPSAEVAADGENYRIIDDEEALDGMIEQIRRHGAFAIDVETTHKDSMRASLVGISVCIEPGAACYIPVAHREGLSPGDGAHRRQLSLERVIDKLLPVLEDSTIQKFAHNGKYDVTVLNRNHASVEGLAFDTMIAAYLVDPALRTLSLKDIGFARLGIEMTPIEALIGKGKAQVTMADVPLHQAADYACRDADVTFRLVEMLETELKKADLWKLFTEVEMPLVPVLARMEQHGVALDVAFLQEISRELYGKIVEVESRVYEAAGRKFNVNSPQQLGTVLFDELRLPRSRRTKTGYSTEAEVLEELRGVHLIIEHVLEYRQLVKLKSTYVDALPLMINPITGRLHTSFNQAGTVTGRLSSSEPNLQNIPIRTEIGRKIRGAFVAPRSDHVLLSADYSQIELRILAHISQDQRLLAAFAADEDIHSATAAEIFGVGLDEVTSDQRRVAKVVNFGIIYGMSDYGLAIGAGLARRDAAEYIDNYLAKYSGVSKYVAETKQRAAEQGYVTTVLGRRRYLPEINVSHRIARQAAERTAINMPIQGTAADIIKIAMIRLDQALTRLHLRSKMILQVHDELLFEVPVDELDRIRSLVIEIMESALPLDVRLKVDVKVGRNWNDMEK
ncbi:MAG: DNA polymerase I [Chloroflexi bacterium]|nr:DNA polymerase I [Chloroflexota bacterium]